MNLRRYRSRLSSADTTSPEGADTNWLHARLPHKGNDDLAFEWASVISQNAPPDRQPNGTRHHLRRFIIRGWSVLASAWSQRPMLRRSMTGLAVLLSFIGSVAWGVHSGQLSLPAAQTQQPASLASGDRSIPLKADSNQLQVQGTNPGLVSGRYSQELEGAATNVTVQVAPDNFRANPAAALKAFAGSMKADQSIPAGKWGTAYVLTNNGVQVAVVANAQYLVVVQSFGEHPAAVWTEFLDAIKS